MFGRSEAEGIDFVFGGCEFPLGLGLLVGFGGSTPSANSRAEGATS